VGTDRRRPTRRYSRRWPSRVIASCPQIAEWWVDGGFSQLGSHVLAGLAPLGGRGIFPGSQLLDLGGAELAFLAAAFPLLISVPAAVKMLRNARTSVTYELHEGGLARVRNGVRQAWTWDQVKAIDTTTACQDLVCFVRFADGEVPRLSNADTGDARSSWARSRSAAPSRRSARATRPQGSRGRGDGARSPWSARAARSRRSLRATARPGSRSSGRPWSGSWAR